MKVYLAGPMSGIPQFNFPEFYRVASILRSKKYNLEVVSPAELDDADTAAAALNSKDGTPADAHRSWGDFLSRDVKMLADDGIEGIVFLPNWQKSRGARLEASVGLLCGYSFFEWAYDKNTLNFYVREMTSLEVATELFIANTKGVTMTVKGYGT